MAKCRVKQTKDDEFYTPKSAVEVIAEYLPPTSKIWCPFDKDESNFVKVLRGLGHKVVNTHIDYGQDFFEEDVPEGTEYIISNPPYSKKDQVYQRLDDLKIPFAMLMNATGIADSRFRAELFSEGGVQVLYLYPRVKYIKDGKVMKQSLYQSAYVCRNVLPTDLIIKLYIPGKPEDEV